MPAPLADVASSFSPGSIATGPSSPGFIRVRAPPAQPSALIRKDAPKPKLPASDVAFAPTPVMIASVTGMRPPAASRPGLSISLTVTLARFAKASGSSPASSLSTNRRNAPPISSGVLTSAVASMGSMVAGPTADASLTTSPPAAKTSAPKLAPRASERSSNTFKSTR